MYLLECVQLTKTTVQPGYCDGGGLPSHRHSVGPVGIHRVTLGALEKKTIIKLLKLIRKQSLNKCDDVIRK